MSKAPQTKEEQALPLPASVRPLDNERLEFVIRFTRPMGVQEMNFFHRWLLTQMLGYASPKVSDE